MKLVVVRMDGAGNPDTAAGRPKGRAADQWEGHLWALLPGAADPIQVCDPFVASSEKRLEKRARHNLSEYAREHGIDEDGVSAELTTMPAGHGVNWRRFAID